MIIKKTPRNKSLGENLAKPTKQDLFSLSSCCSCCSSYMHAYVICT